MAGDYDGSGTVGQGDLNLVLLNWGATGVPAGWVNHQPSGQIGQTELNAALLNWGTTTEPTASGIPEPASGLLLLPALLLRKFRS